MYMDAAGLYQRDQKKAGDEMTLEDLNPLWPVLSIRQPWAWLIVNGYKDIENREWPTDFRGRFYIHAPQTVESVYRQIFPLNMPHHYETGGIVGEAEITDCVTSSNSPWFESTSRFGFVIAEAKPLPFIACRGQLGFFKLPAPRNARQRGLFDGA